MACEYFSRVKTTRNKTKRLKYTVVACFDPIIDGYPVSVEPVAKFSAYGDACTYASSLSKAPMTTYVNIED